MPELAEALDRMWPRLSPDELLHDLFGAPPLIAAAARGTLSPEEQALLRRAVRPPSTRWPGRRRTPRSSTKPGTCSVRGSGGGDDGVRKYGHIVVDEVQDLSPMQLRMLTRRSLSGSMTVVGDIAQATAPWAPTSWGDIVEHLPNRRPSRTAELTVSYRTPAEVLAVAGRVLAVAAPGLTPPQPVRRSGVEPAMLAVRSDDGDPGPADLTRTVAHVAATEVDAVRPGRVAIVPPRPCSPRCRRPWPRPDIRWSMPGTIAGRPVRALVLLAAESANGLEFDSVVVVEPATIAGETSGVCGPSTWRSPAPPGGSRWSRSRRRRPPSQHLVEDRPDAPERRLPTGWPELAFRAPDGVKLPP